MKRLFGALYAAMFLILTVDANAGLLGRLPVTPGGTDYQVAYDDVLDISWLTDANANPDGNVIWESAKTWADGLDTLGFADWRLPYASVAAGAGPIIYELGYEPEQCDGSGGMDEVACRDNEMAYMFYYNLGGTQGSNQTGDRTVGGINLTNIQNIQSSGTEAGEYLGSIDGDIAWRYGFNGGGNGIIYQSISPIARAGGWAVRSGDVGAAAVPAPATWLLMAAGLGLLGFGRKPRRS